MYNMLERPVDRRVLGCWTSALGPFSEVVGYSHLGSIFLRERDILDYIVLHPLSRGNNAKSYGVFSSPQEFEAKVLKDPSFIDEVLRPEDLSRLELSLGTLGGEEVYYPVPFPCLGGSGALSTYQKGNVWVFVDLVGQSLGLGDRP